MTFTLFLESGKIHYLPAQRPKGASLPEKARCVWDLLCVCVCPIKKGHTHQTLQACGSTKLHRRRHCMQRLARKELINHGFGAGNDEI